jgi:hypothetical protein
MNPLSYHISHTILATIFIIALLFSTKLVHGQAERQSISVFNVNCVLPDVVETGSEFTVTYEIAKDVGYVGPFRIIQKLTNGFRLIDDTLAYAEISSDKQQFEIFYEHLPLGNTYSFDLTFAVGKISQAVYPFYGAAYFYGFSIPYGEPVMVMAPKEIDDFGDNEGFIGPLKIAFELPEKIVAGKEFTFITIFNKESGYLASGKIIQKWPDHFQPRATVLQNAGLKVTNNDVEISWDKLEQGTYFSIAYQVFVRKTANGIFPVISNFSDEHGLKLVENTGIFVVNEDQPQIVDRAEIQEKIHKVWFRHPTEVVFGSEFELTVFIQKGKYTGPGNLHVKLPLGCEIEIIGEQQYSYDISNGELLLNWDNMPASPVVEVRIVINTKKVSRAVYPIDAQFYRDEKVLASKSSHIIISDKLQLATLKKMDENLSVPDKTDTTEMFSKMDKLLNKWQESITGINKTDSKKNENIGENYRIQILASKQELPNIKKLLLSMNIKEYYNVHYDDEYYRHTVGVFKTRAECSEYLKFVRSKGFADAFVVKYIDGGPAKGD